MATRNINTFIEHLMNENLSSKMAKKSKRDPYPTSSGVQSMAKDELTDYGSAVVDNARSRASDVGAAIKGAVRGDLKPAHTALINAVDAAVDAPGNVAARVGSAFKPDAKYGTTETRKGTTRAEVEQGMKDDERESGRRIGAFKHADRPTAVTRGSIDMMGRLDALPMGEIRRAVTGAAAPRKKPSMNEARVDEWPYSPDVVHTYPGTAEETPQETPEERAKRERTERFAKAEAAMFAKSWMTRRERIKQNMRDDERESGRRIGAFKHPKPEPKPEKAQPSYEDLLGGPKPKEYTIIYDPDAGKPRKRPNS